MSDDALEAMVGTRIDFGKRPQEQALPAVTLQVTADPRPNHFGGRQGLRQTRLQVDCWGETADAAVSAAERIIEIIGDPAVVDGVRFEKPLIEGPEDSGNQEDTLYVHRARLSVLVWHALV